MEDLNFDNIMSEFDMENLFGGEIEGNDNTVHQEGDNSNDVTKAETEDNINTDVNPNTLFGGLETQESVGVESKSNEGENRSSKETENSPENNFHSSILGALKNDGILPELTDEDIQGVKDDRDFSEMIEKVVSSRVDLRTKRIEDALSSGEVDADQVKWYENTIATLNSIDDATIMEESDKGSDLRRRIIAQDYMNKGFSRERIERELKKSFEAGTDIDDAKEALQNNIQFYQGKYNEIIQHGQEEQRRLKEQNRKQSEDLKKSIVDAKDGIFNEIGVDLKTRQKIYDNITKPVYKDENGNLLTAIQKYEKENRTDFIKYLSLFYTMTDGFTKIDNLIKKPVLKQNKSYVANLEKMLQGSQRNSSGNLKMVGEGDPESQYLGENFILDF